MSVNTRRLGRCCGIFLLLLVSSAPAQPPGPPKGPPPALVTVAPVIERDVLGGQAFVGTIMPLRTSSVGSAVDGRVINCPINAGDRVSKGQVLAELLTGQLDIQLAGAKAELELRQHALQELTNGSRPEEKQQAEARYAGRKAVWDYVSAKLQRYRKLFERGTVTQEDLDAVISEADVAFQNHAEAKAGWDLVIQGPRKELIAQAQARVAVQQEEVRAIEDQIAKHTIRSPFNGYVVEEFTEVGQWVAKAGLVCRVVELDQVDVELMVLETFLPSLQLGQTTRIEVPALPGQFCDGQIAIIVPQADPRSRSFPIRVRMKNRFDGDRPVFSAGMFARVTLPVGQKKSAILVPKDALVFGGPTPVVFVVDPDPKNPKQGTVRMVSVELGVADGPFIEIRGMVKPGDKVVTRGNERLRPPGPVTILEDNKPTSR